TAVFPHLERRRADLAEMEDDLVAVFDSLPIDRFERLADTDVYARLRGRVGTENFREPSVEGLTRHALAQGTRTVRVGPSHGDPEPDDTMPLAAGGLVLIDWEYGERCNPRFLDVVYAATEFHAERRGRTIAEAVSDY